MKVKALFILLFAANLCFGQDAKIKNELIELGKIYHGRYVPSTADAQSSIDAVSSPELARAKKFIAEIKKEKTDIGSKEYLTKPDSLTLKYLYVAVEINYTLFEKQPKDNKAVRDSLLSEKTPYGELISSYYGMIFSRLLDKGDDFDMTGIDFRLNEYNLNTDTEKGIFFLRAMERLGTLIWGYMNIPKPPNYKEALTYIDKYPKFNGQNYYQFTNLDIKDFNLTIDKEKPKVSFKKYYLTKYMNTVLYHLVCLSQPGTDQAKKQDIFNGSIIKNEAYWPFYEDPALFKSIFKGR